jgi:hypothetical protein
MTTLILSSSIFTADSWTSGISQLATVIVVAARGVLLASNRSRSLQVQARAAAQAAKGFDYEDV